MAAQIRGAKSGNVSLCPRPRKGLDKGD